MATQYSGTQTEKNLMEAFAGESQARNKYTYFASKAKKEGYEQIAAIFQPHLYTRTRDFYREFAEALSGLDAVYLRHLSSSRTPHTRRDKPTHLRQLAPWSGATPHHKG